MKKTLVVVLAFLTVLACSPRKSEYRIEKTGTIFIHQTWKKDAAVNAALNDLRNTLRNIYGADVTVHTDNDSVNVTPYSIVVGDSTNAFLRELIDRKKLHIPQLQKDGFYITELKYRGNPLLIIAGNDIRANCYGVYHLIEKIKLGRMDGGDRIEITRNPNMTFRMITQPFEAVGYPPVARLPKPIIVEREFDPMRPMDGAGYDAEDEARNILRSGLNVFYIGSYAFATLYDYWKEPLHPRESEAWRWVLKRRARFRELINAAEKYHLDVCVNGDVFVFPKTASPEDKWKLLRYSLNEILTDFPEIDYVISRFGENYSFFNPYFQGGFLTENEMPRAIDLIYDIVVRKFRKKYICRTWAIGSDTWHSVPEKYLNIERQVRGRDGLAFSFKHTHTDFWRYNKFNPCFGVGKHEQVAEYNCQDGYHYKQAIPYFEVLRMANGAKELDQVAGMKVAHEKGVRSVWSWLNADGWCGPYAKQEEWLRSNIYGFTHLAWDVDASPEELAKEWAAIEFNVRPDSKVAQNLWDILRLSEDLILKLRYFRQYALKEDPWSPCRNWMRDELIAGGDIATTENSCPRAARPGTLKPIFNPATIEEDCQEKQEAMDIVDRMVAQFAEIQPLIPDADKARNLYNTLLYAKYFTYAASHYVIGIFRFYNGDYAEAEKHLRAWKENWDYYQNEIPKLPGAPTLIKDGGMVQTCTEAMKEIEKRKGGSE